jgi:hypothetical protein
VHTNKSPKQWAENLGDEVITTVIFERMVEYFSKEGIEVVLED